MNLDLDAKTCKKHWKVTKKTKQTRDQGAKTSKNLGR